MDFHLSRLFLASLLLPTLTFAATVYDADHDGMSDIWQRLYNITTNDTEGDPDSDGYPNMLEAIAGTNPRDNQSRPLASPTTTNAPTNNGNVTAFTFGWKTQAGKQYEMSSSPNLTTWTVHTNTIVGNGSMMNYTFVHATPQAARFYRARARATELDTDDDGLTDWEESLLGTSSTDGDSDNDGMPDKWEWQNWLQAAVAGGFGDADTDGVPDLGEYLYGLKANDSDSDDDGISDADEFPWLADPDLDGLTNLQELLTHQTHPKNRDTDRDKMSDGWEVAYGLNPKNATGADGPDNDNDSDGLSNLKESQLGTNPNNADTDGDGHNDKKEYDEGSNPNDPADNGPSPYGVVEAKLVMGDGSSSDSESYRFTLEMMEPAPGPAKHFDSAYGVVQTFYHKLKRGAKYKLTMSHLGTDPDAIIENPKTTFPDYDYTLTVDETRAVFVVDPYAAAPTSHPMLGGHGSDDDEHPGSFWPSGKECYVYTPVVDVEIDGKTESQEESPGALLVKNADNNNAPRLPFIIKKLIPASCPAKVTLLQETTAVPGATPATVTLYDAQTNGTSLAVNETGVEIANADLPKTYWAEGTVESAAMRDFSFKAKVNGANDKAKFTVLWVDTPEVKFSGEISPNNDSRLFYIGISNDDTASLELKRFLPDIGERLGWGYEAKAGVHPASFSYAGVDLMLDRDMEYRRYSNTSLMDSEEQDDIKNFSAAIPPGNDDSRSAFNDNNPQPDNMIYDCDAPGLPWVSGAQTNAIMRARINFKTFGRVRINISGTSTYVRCSTVTSSFIRFSMRQTGTPTAPNWVKVEPADVTGDNQAAVGTTPISWNLAP